PRFCPVQFPAGISDQIFNRSAFVFTAYSMYSKTCRQADFFLSRSKILLQNTLSDTFRHIPCPFPVCIGKADQKLIAAVSCSPVSPVIEVFFYFSRNPC